MDVAHRLNSSAACGIFPDQGSNLCLLHWWVDSYSLYHQGSPGNYFKMDRPKELSETFISSIVCYSDEIAGNYSLKWWNRSTTFSNNTRMSKLNVQCFSKGSLKDFSDGAVVKNPPANSGDARDLGVIPGLERSLGWEMATCPSSLVWKIPWREDPGRL